MSSTDVHLDVPNQYPGNVLDVCKVAVIGAGPAGLMLAANLVRFGIKTKIFDDRESSTSTGRADGLQPKSIETLKQMRLADGLLQKGVKIYDIAFWKSTATQSLHRTARQVHYPDDRVGALDPYILLVHQGMVEDVFIQDMKARGVEVTRRSSFCGVIRKPDRSLHIICKDVEVTTTSAQFLIGCDGARSAVRRTTGIIMDGDSGNASWGVLDGVIQTNFPDLWSKVVITSETGGTILCIPRERNMTRLYIELKSSTNERVSQEDVMQKAKEIISPFNLEWKSVEWFGNYYIGQRVATRFMDDSQQVFIAGDAAHTHSPKAAQGMNTSMHDGFNLAWKLNLAVRGLSKSCLLETYGQERRKIAQDLITFDKEHVAAFKGGDAALASNFDDNIRFISGVGAEYDDNVLNISGTPTGLLRAGALLPPARVTRYIDANPVDIQLDIPLLGQFRIYFFAPDAVEARQFLESVCQKIESPSSIIGHITMAAKCSYAATPHTRSEEDAFIQFHRYTNVSPLFTFSLVTQTPKHSIEIADLPSLLQESRWTFYLDNLANGKDLSCTNKWFGEVRSDECIILNVRPDGYVGGFWRYGLDDRSACRAAASLEAYYGGFLKA